MIFSRPWIRPLAAAAVIVAVIGWLVARPAQFFPTKAAGPSKAELAAAVQPLDEYFAAQWQQANLEPAAAVDDLILLRRLSLALVGTVPSIEEIREFEADDATDRVARWTARLIADPRFVEYFGMALGEAFIDIRNDDLEIGPRLRFVQWLGESIQDGRGYDEMAREIIADGGVLADQPGAAMVAAEFSGGPLAAERLAARTSRALLGQRIDCAQCHDHPFAEWTQDQFEGLAAHFGQVNYKMATLADSRRGAFVIDDTRNNLKREVEPVVPFDSEWLTDDVNLREQLAEWVTHPENRRFRRAIANRLWGLMFGRPLVNPVDDLPNPPDVAQPDALDLIANDLAANGHDLRRTIHLIAASAPFRLDSAHPGLDKPTVAAILDKTRAVFPVTELDAHQLIRSMQQAASVRTILPQTESTYAQIRRFDSRFRFAQLYGDEPADGEPEADTVPQAVQRLSGNTVRALSRRTPFSAAGRIGALAAPEQGIDQAFLACLTRRPTPEESAFFLGRPAKNANQRGQTAEDIYWTLFNSAEFCWNH